MRTSVKWKGKEVENPALRAAILLLGITIGFFGLMIGFLGIVIGFFVIILGILIIVAVIILLAVISPGVVIIHLILRALGRRGFIEVKNGEIFIDVSGKGFQKK